MGCALEVILERFVTEIGLDRETSSFTRTRQAHTINQDTLITAFTLLVQLVIIPVSSGAVPFICRTNLGGLFLPFQSGVLN